MNVANGTTRGMAARVLWGVLLLVSLAAAVILLRQSALHPVPAGLLASSFPGLTVGGIVLQNHLRRRQRWRAAWDAYGALDLAHGVVALV